MPTEDEIGYQKWRAGKQTIESQIPTHDPHDEAMYVPSGDCNIPFTFCWCQSHPTNPHCKSVLAVPINSGVWVLIIAGIGLGMWYLRRVLKENEKKEKLLTIELASKNES